MKDQDIKNEAELGFCIGPGSDLCGIILCDAWGYKEESVKDQTAAAQPGSSAAPQQPASTSPQQPLASPQQAASLHTPASSPATSPRQQSALPPASTASGPGLLKSTPKGLKLQTEVITGLSRADYTVYIPNSK